MARSKKVKQTAIIHGPTAYIEEAQKEFQIKQNNKPSLRKCKGIFVTATDTEVGKTVATYVLALLLRNENYKVGVMKPIQCSGNDTYFLKNNLDIKDSVKEINPYYSKEAFSPHIAFHRKRVDIKIDNIIQSYNNLEKKYDIVLVEGAGGLLVPIKKNYLMVDLIRDLGLEVIIVSKLGLGTINHTLLTINQAKENGLEVKGVLFNESKAQKIGIPEKTNPFAIKEYGNVSLLGSIPYLNNLPAKNKKGLSNNEIIKKCKARINLKKILGKQDKKISSSELDKKYIWHPFTQMKDWLKEEQLVIEKANGSYLIDEKGNKYLDGISSLWVNVHGHRHKQIDQAIKDQVNKVSHSTLLGLANAPSAKLAEKLIEITPRSLEKVFYSDDGSTSVEIALKMAYQYWQNTGKKKKTDIMHLANSYHGDTLGSVSVGGIDLFHKVYKKLIFNTIAVPFPDCYRASKGKKYPEYAFECLKRMEQIIKRRHQTVAAFIVEPIVQGASGMIIWPKGVLKNMYEICKKYNIIFIADEVATGFGRTGKMFACEHENIAPDILCLAKGLTGGYLPLAATLTSKKIFDGFIFDYKDQKTFFHGHSYTGNPLGCAAALANIEIFQKEKIISKLQPKIIFLQENLKKFKNLKHVGDVRQLGLMMGLELVKNRKTKNPFPWKDKIGIKVCMEARKKGVILRPLGNVIVLMPPLSMSIDELKELLKVTYFSIKRITEGK